MKNLTFLFLTIFSFSAISQTYDQCGTHQAMMDYAATHPGYLQSVNETFARAKQNVSQDRSTVYTVPVVVHIVFNTPEENLDDSVVFNQIERMNEDFRRLNMDTVNTRDTFLTIVGDSYIQFQLAGIDPDGNPTTGITRTNTSVTSFLAVGGTPAEGVKSTADGGIDPWDQDHYLNIWVCDMSLFGTPFLLGYATPPNNLPNWPAGSSDGMSDGVVIQYEAFGSNNPNTLDVGGGPLTVMGRTCVHEVGHYLGLRHIWADGDCTEEDGIDDTPNAADQSNQDCNFAANTCTDAIGALGDLPDMVENYMDYSAETCQNSFTLGQVDLMRGVLEVERFDLINNNPAVGIQDEKPAADFTIYPNPSKGDFNLVNLPSGNKEITVFGETGQVIRSISSDASTIELNGLSQGLYYVSIKTGTNVITKKLVVLN